MSRWLDTTGKSSLQLVICDRCKRKVSVTDVVQDPNSPGLWVCGPQPAHRRGNWSESCVDVLDPWRLPPRDTENIAPDHPRLDIDISATAVMPGTPEWPFLDDPAEFPIPPGPNIRYLITESGEFILTENGQRISL